MKHTIQLENNDNHSFFIAGSEESLLEDCSLWGKKIFAYLIRNRDKHCTYEKIEKDLFEQGRDNTGYYRNTKIGLSHLRQSLGCTKSKIHRNNYVLTHKYDNILEFVHIRAYENFPGSVCLKINSIVEIIENTIREVQVTLPQAFCAGKAIGECAERMLPGNEIFRSTLERDWLNPPHPFATSCKFLEEVGISPEKMYPLLVHTNWDLEKAKNYFQSNIKTHDNQHKDIISWFHIGMITPLILSTEIKNDLLSNLQDDFFIEIESISNSNFRLYISKHLKEYRDNLKTTNTNIKSIIFEHVPRSLRNINLKIEIMNRLEKLSYENEIGQSQRNY